MEDKHERLNQEIFKLSQQIEELKWEYGQTLSKKEA